MKETDVNLGQTEYTDEDKRRFVEDSFYHEKLPDDPDARAARIKQIRLEQPDAQ